MFRKEGHLDKQEAEKGRVRFYFSFIMAAVMFFYLRAKKKHFLSVVAAIFFVFGKAWFVKGVIYVIVEK